MAGVWRVMAWVGVIAWKGGSDQGRGRGNQSVNICTQEMLKVFLALCLTYMTGWRDHQIRGQWGKGKHQDSPRVRGSLQNIGGIRGVFITTDMPGPVW